MEAAGFEGGSPPFEIRERIVALVRHHGLPATLLDKPCPQRAIITASMTAPCDLLAILAEADARGRVLIGADDSRDRIQLFRKTCVENECLDRPYRFASDHSRVRYFKTPGAPAHATGVRRRSVRGHRHVRPARQRQGSLAERQL